MTPRKLKRERLKREWSQFKLSKESGVSRYIISLIENGYREMTEKEEEKFKRCLRIK